MVPLLLELIQGEALSGFAASATGGEIGILPPPVRDVTAAPRQPKTFPRGSLLDVIV